MPSMTIPLSTSRSIKYAPLIGFWIVSFLMLWHGGTDVCRISMKCPRSKILKKHLTSLFRPQKKSTFNVYDPIGIKHLYQLRLGLSRVAVFTKPTLVWVSSKLIKKHTISQTPPMTNVFVELVLKTLITSCSNVLSAQGMEESWLLQWWESLFLKLWVTFLIQLACIYMDTIRYLKMKTDKLLQPLLS